MEFLRANGSRWDGSVAQWDTFAPWFSYEAGRLGLAEPADALLAYLARYPDAEGRIAVLAQYGVTIAVAEPVEDAPDDAPLSEDPVSAQLIEATYDDVIAPVMSEFTKLADEAGIDLSQFSAAELSEILSTAVAKQL